MIIFVHNKYPQTTFISVREFIPADLFQIALKIMRLRGEKNKRILKSLNKP